MTKLYPHKFLHKGLNLSAWKKYLIRCDSDEYINQDGIKNLQSTCCIGLKISLEANSVNFLDIKDDKRMLNDLKK